ncbi:MAG: hypothetical protein D6812_02880 [Deltaproteobacteria bacterium]|nr:MAG: hypothetical protein D6812_02880 [Deltaproteobacteria bacterium]
MLIPPDDWNEGMLVQQMPEPPSHSWDDGFPAALFNSSPSATHAIPVGIPLRIELIDPPFFCFRALLPSGDLSTLYISLIENARFRRITTDTAERWLKALSKNQPLVPKDSSSTEPTDWKKYLK